MLTIQQQGSKLINILINRGLEPHLFKTWSNPNKIVYHFISTNRGKYVVKYDYEYFRKFGFIYHNECDLGDSFDEAVVNEMSEGDVFVFAKKEGIFEVDYKTFKLNCVKRLIKLVRMSKK